jgi:hypothetical protein
LAAAVAELEAGLIGERTKAALAAKVARDGRWDGNASHHLVPGAGQRAASKAVSEEAMRRTADLGPIIAELRQERRTSLRDIAAALSERDIPTPTLRRLGTVRGAQHDRAHRGRLTGTHDGGRRWRDAARWAWLESRRTPPLPPTGGNRRRHDGRLPP